MSNFRLSLDYLPRETFRQLSRKAMLVGREYVQLFNIKGKEVSLRYAHITPSLSYIAGKTGLSICQVSRANTELASTGIINRQQLRTSQGGWRNNIIKLGSSITTLWKAFQDKKKGNKNAGLQKSANIGSKEALEDNYFGEFMKMMKNIGLKGMRPAPA